MLDGAVYIRLADNLSSGNGYVLNNLESSGGFSDWPPAYAVSILLIKLCSGANTWIASKCVNLLAVTGISILFLRRFKEKAWVAMLTLTFSTSIWLISNTFSETLFLFFVCLHVIHMERIIKRFPAKRSLLFLVIGTLGAIYTRYAGLFLIPMTFIVLLAFKQKHGRWNKILIKALFSTLVGVIGLLIFNKTNSGSYMGSRRASQSSIPDILQEFVRSLHLELSLWNPTGGYFSSEILALLIGILLLLTLIFLAIRQKAKVNWAIILWCYATTYIAFLIGSKTFVALHWFDRRLAYPFVFLMALGLSYIAVDLKSPLKKATPYAISVILLLYYSYYVLINFTKTDTDSRVMVESFPNKLALVQEKYRSVSPNSVVLFAEAEVLFLRRDIVVKYPLKWPYVKNNESWSQFKARVLQQYPGNDIFVNTISLQEASIYHSSIVDYMKNAENHLTPLRYE